MEENHDEQHFTERELAGSHAFAMGWDQLFPLAIFEDLCKISDTAKQGDDRRVHEGGILSVGFDFGTDTKSGSAQFWNTHQPAYPELGLSSIDGLSSQQKLAVKSVLSGETEAAASLAAIEARLAETRQCPHCGTPGAVSKGMARGLRRYQCKACKKTFNAATGTAIQCFHNKGRCLIFGECPTEGLTVRESAERCDFAVSTAFRWRHRFLGTQDQTPPNLKGIVEADETYVLESRKGDRNLDRKARRRGGKASKRGLSDEQVPILVAVDRSKTMTCSVLPSVTADNVRSVLEPRIDDDIVLVTDGNNVYPPCAKSLGIQHEALNQSAGERAHGSYHIQTVNSRHSQFNSFLYRYRGVASKYLGNYLRWFERCSLLKSSPRSYLAIAIGGSFRLYAN